MVRKMMAVSALTLVLMFVFWGVFLATEKRTFYTLGIVSLTVCFHFSIRLAIGGVIDYFFKNNVDYTKKRYEQKSFEKGLYKALRVKKWKKMMPTANEEYFSLNENSLEDVIMAGCQAENIHLLCAASGFLTLFFAIFFGDLLLFFVTAFIGAIYDLMFVIIQRYNRPRLMKAYKREMIAKARKMRNNS